MLRASTWPALVVFCAILLHTMDVDAGRRERYLTAVFLSGASALATLALIQWLPLPNSSGTTLAKLFLSCLVPTLVQIAVIRRFWH